MICQRCSLTGSCRAINASGRSRSTRGSCNNRHLCGRTLLAELRIRDHVFLLGERQDTPRLTAAFDLACSSSAWGESFSTAIGEAMACGVPCVVTDVGDSAYLVGDTGLCVPPQNHEALAQAMLQLISADPDRRRQLGASARRRIEEEFSLREIVGRYEALYSGRLAC